MKCTLNKKGDVYTVYVPKKDMELEVVSVEKTNDWGGIFTMSNGWVLDFSELEAEPSLPQTFNITIVSKGE
ncbi:MAG: putative nitrogen fixation protein NifT [Denitrovibrio sp.]|nr:MAG: putative nitrogen fixation protein NifT [Denitrovibrio sp.]